MLSNKKIVCPHNLLNEANKKKGVKAGIVNAGKPLPMESVRDAVNENLINPIFIGDTNQILKCAEDLKWNISSYQIIQVIDIEAIPICIQLYRMLVVNHVAYRLNVRRS